MATAQEVYDGLLARGMSPVYAEAFVMNAQDESGLRTDVNEAAPLVEGSRGGFGLMQWTGPRRVALEQFAESKGASVSDLGTQLDFLMYELEGPESAAAQSIFSAQDTGSAASAIVNEFLRPAEEHRARRSAAYSGDEGGQYAALQGSAASQNSLPASSDRERQNILAQLDFSPVYENRMNNNFLAQPVQAVQTQNYLTRYL